MSQLSVDYKPLSYAFIPLLIFWVLFFKFMPEDANNNYNSRDHILSSGLFVRLHTSSLSQPESCHLFLSISCPSPMKLLSLSLFK